MVFSVSVPNIRSSSNSRNIRISDWFDKRFRGVYRRDISLIEVKVLFENNICICARLKKGRLCEHLRRAVGLATI